MLLDSEGKYIVSFMHDYAPSANPRQKGLCVKCGMAKGHINHYGIAAKVMTRPIGRPMRQVTPEEYKRLFQEQRKHGR